MYSVSTFIIWNSQCQGSPAQRSTRRQWQPQTSGIWPMCSSLERCALEYHSQAWNHGQLLMCHWLPDPRHCRLVIETRWNLWLTYGNRKLNWIEALYYAREHPLCQPVKVGSVAGVPHSDGFDDSQEANVHDKESPLIIFEGIKVLIGLVIAGDVKYFFWSKSSNWFGRAVIWYLERRRRACGWM